MESTIKSSYYEEFDINPKNVPFVIDQFTPLAFIMNDLYKLGKFLIKCVTGNFELAWAWGYYCIFKN